MIAKLKQDTILRGWTIDHEFKDIAYKSGDVLDGIFVLDNFRFVVYDEENDLEFWINPELVSTGD